MTAVLEGLMRTVVLKELMSPVNQKPSKWLFSTSVVAARPLVSQRLRCPWASRANGLSHLVKKRSARLPTLLFYRISVDFATDVLFVPKYWFVDGVLHTEYTRPTYRAACKAEH